MFFLKKKTNWKVGLLPAAQLAGYIALVATILTNADKFFGKQDIPYLAPVFGIMLFVVSALTSALIVFAKPYQLFIDKKGGEALQLVIATTKWLIFFLVVVFVIIFFWR